MVPSKKSYLEHPSLLYISFSFLLHCIIHPKSKKTYAGILKASEYTKEIDFYVIMKYFQFTLTYISFFQIQVDLHTEGV